MSVGLFLLAKLNKSFRDPDLFLQQIASWIRGEYGGVNPKIRRGLIETKPTLFCQLHPAAEELELSLVDGSHLTASASTSSAGPGYHIFVCEMLHALGRKFQASWAEFGEESEEYFDEGEYFFTGDQRRVFDHMTAWLGALAGSFFDGTLAETATALCMDTSLRFASDQLAITPLGPRNRDWLRATAQDGNNGRDFFAWWTPGLDASYYLGRALAQMWSSVRWRKPINESEWALLREVAECLRLAHGLNPALDYPWAEWDEILTLLGAGAKERELVRSKVKQSPKIGYRRRNVTVLLPGGWQIRLPGSFGDFKEDEDNTLLALDPPREVWFSAFHSTDPLSEEQFKVVRAEIRATGPEYIRETESYIASAAVEQKTANSGELYFVLNSSNCCPGKRAVCTIVFRDPKDADWAVETWRSLTPPTPADGAQDTE